MSRLCLEGCNSSTAFLLQLIGTFGQINYKYMMFHVNTGIWYKHYVHYDVYFSSATVCIMVSLHMWYNLHYLCHIMMHMMSHALERSIHINNTPSKNTSVLTIKKHPAIFHSHLVCYSWATNATLIGSNWLKSQSWIPPMPVALWSAVDKMNEPWTPGPSSNLILECRMAMVTKGQHSLWQLSLFFGLFHPKEYWKHTI